MLKTFSHVLKKTDSTVSTICGNALIAAKEALLDRIKRVYWVFYITHH